MTADQYVNSIVNKYKLPQKISQEMNMNVVSPLSHIINKWAGDCLNELAISGSRAKGTAINIATDLDLFISLKSTTTNTLEEIYNSLHTTLITNKITARKQNVSIGVSYAGYDIDLVPAKRQDNYGSDHSLYRNKADTWTKTNVATHINTVKNSNRITEIVAIKIWRERFSLNFPSMYLELTVIEALKGKHSNQPANNFMTILDYLINNFLNKTVYDPSNTNNIISEDLYKYEKEAIVKQAKESRCAKLWKDIIW